MELEAIKNEVHAIKQELGSMAEIKLQVKEIREALLGNEFNNKNGMVKQVEDHEERLEKLEESSVTNKMYLSILRFLAGIITTGVVALIFALFKKML